MPATSAPPPATPGAPTHPWRWIPTLYFSQGLPYVVVMTLAVVMYKNLGVSNTDIALLTSWLYLPWVIKPLWGPVVDLLGTKRRWIVALQFLVGALLGMVALAVPAPAFLQMTLVVFWLMAFASATHDIAADGFYMLAQPAPQQAAFVGVRSTCYRLAMIGGQGGLVYLAGHLQQTTGNVATAWAWVFGLMAAFFVAVAVWHHFVLPRPASDRPVPRSATFFADFAAVFVAFFKRPGVARILAFLLLYRFAEAQLLKLVTPFLLDPRSAGGENPNKTAHYALCTGFMALGMMLPGMWAGWLQDQLGYTNFFIWACVATLPSFAAAALLRIDPAFGKKAD